MDMPDHTLYEHWLHKRDADAFTELVKRHGRMVYSTCCRVLGNPSEAEDVAQECFLQLASQQRPLRSPGGWLHRIATHRSLDRLRGESRRIQRESRFGRETIQQQAPTWDDLREYMDAAIAQLPDKIQAPLVAHYFEGQTYDALAEEMGIPRATAASRVARGVELLRQDLKKKGLILGAVTLAGLLANAPSHALPGSLHNSLMKLALSGPLPAATASSAGAAGLLLKFAGACVLLAAVVGGIWAVRSGQHVQPTQSEANASAEWVAPEPRETSPTDLQLASTANTANASEAREVSLPSSAVTGIVLDEAGDPVAGAVVKGRSTPMSHAYTRSDFEGRFTLTDLDRSTNLYVQATRKTDATGEDVLQRSMSAPLGPFELDQSGIQDLVLTLHPAGSIQGRLVDAAGKPLPDMFVAAFQKHLDLHHPPYAKTDQSGMFKLVDCAADTYLLLAFPQGKEGIAYDTALAEVTLQPGEARHGLLLEYAPYLRLAGTVVDESGTPLAGVHVRSAYEGTSTETDAYGAFDLEGFGEKPLDLIATHPEYLQARLKPESELENLQFVLQERPRAQGRVIHATSRQPIQDFEILHMGRSFRWNSGASLKNSNLFMTAKAALKSGQIG